MRNKETNAETGEKKFLCVRDRKKASVCCYYALVPLSSVTSGSSLGKELKRVLQESVEKWPYMAHIQ